MGYRVTKSRFSRCMHPVDKRGESLLRQLAKWDLLVLNGRTERDSRGSETFVWGEEQRRSVLDLAIAPKNLSADMEVSQVWDTTQMQHRAIFVWAHLGSLD